MSGVLPPITFEISAADMGVSLSARDNLKSCHTVLHCPERKLAETQIAFWQCHQQDIIDRTVKGDQVFGSIPYSMFDPHPGYNANSDVRLNVVPCAVCEPNRYGKAVMVEKLE